MQSLIISIRHHSSITLRWNRVFVTTPHPMLRTCYTALDTHPPPEGTLLFLNLEIEEQKNKKKRRKNSPQRWICRPDRSLKKVTFACLLYPPPLPMLRFGYTKLWPPPTPLERNVINGWCLIKQNMKRKSNILLVLIKLKLKLFIINIYWRDLSKSQPLLERRASAWSLSSVFFFLKLWTNWS